MRLRFVVSTRRAADEFFSRSLLALSLENLSASFRFQLEPAFEASSGLAAVYNPAIERSETGDLLVFVHDDIYIEDWHCGVRLAEGLSQFDVLGVAGACNRLDKQPAWFGFMEERRSVIPSELTLSGSIKHVKLRRRKAIARFIEAGLLHLPAGRGAWQKRWIANADGSYACRIPPASGSSVRIPHAGSGSGKLDCFGPAPASVKLLDGAFLAVRADRIKASTVRFDKRFRYHFYDLDFCRQCEAAGLPMGTWPLAIAHGSTGSWNDEWRKARNVYLDKWQG